MKKSLFEHMGGTYHREGDYLLPDLTVPESPHIGIWGERHWEYLRKNKNGIYTGLLLSGKLNAYLEEIDRAAEAMYSDLIAQYAKREGVTEQLKKRPDGVVPLYEQHPQPRGTGRTPRYDQSVMPWD